MLMQSQLVFFVSVAFGFLAWGVVAARYLWPKLRDKQPADALRPVLILHTFRYLGLATLVPGVVSPNLPAGFAHPEAYGDFIAATLAWLTRDQRAGLGAPQRLTQRRHRRGRLGSDR